MWKPTVSCRVDNHSQNHIDVIMLKNSMPDWQLTCYYGFPERSRRREAWDFIRYLAGRSQIPWCIIGDFNDMLYATDKDGKCDHPQYLMNGFSLAIEDTNLVEVLLTGGKFTWEKGKGTSNWVRERLDRAFANDDWWHLFPLCKLTVHHTICSDHEPIVLDLCNVQVTKKQFRFKFENTWLREPEFHNEVKEHWESLPRSSLLPKLISISSFMAKWGVISFTNSGRKSVNKKMF